MGSLVYDFRFVIRQGRKSPGFTLTVILTLALGIGATTSIFSLVEGILLRPLPFRDPDRLVVLGDRLGNKSGIPVTAREIGTYAKAAGAFSTMGGYTGVSYELSGGVTPEVEVAGRETHPDGKSPAGGRGDRTRRRRRDLVHASPSDR